MIFQTIPTLAAEWLVENDYGEVTTSQPVGGGCINNGQRVLTTSGRTLFLKTNRHCPQDMFAREAQGLMTLAVQDGPRTPKPLTWGTDFLLLEDLAPAPPKEGYWEKFGWQMAALHNHTAAQFGFEDDNYLGSTPQPNGWMDDGFEFFGERRLVFQAELAARNDLLGHGDVSKIEKLANRLRSLVPKQPASLLHGDLWSGNAISDNSGMPAIIDPAAHYGWAEAELGMTQLFGAFPEVFYRAYTEVHPLAAGWRERLGVYNIYHLLNHLNLFGAPYLSAVRASLHRYVG